MSVEISVAAKMKIFLPFGLCAVLLSGCKTVAEDVAAHIAIGIVLDPVFDATLEGGKAAHPHQSAANRWLANNYCF